MSRDVTSRASNALANATLVAVYFFTSTPGPGATALHVRMSSDIVLHLGKLGSSSEYLSVASRARYGRIKGGEIIALIHTI